MESGNPPSFRKIWDAIREVSKKADSMRLIHSDVFRVSHTSLGQSITLADTSKTTTSAGMVFRGEWTESYYRVGDVVVVYGGQSQGTYICIKEHQSGRGIKNGSEIEYVGIHPVPYSTDYASIDANSDGNLYWVEFTYRQAKAVNW